MLEELFGFIEARVEAARQAGTLDAGVETIRAESLTCLGRDVLTTCPKSGAETILTAIERRQRIKRLAAAELHATHHAGQPMRHDKTGKVALAVPARSLLTEEGGLVEQRRLIRPGSTKLVTGPDLEKSAWQKIGELGFDLLWDEEMEALPEFSVDELNLLSGMLLPVWKLLPFDNQRVYRLELDDGTALLGRVFTKDEAGIVRARLKPTEANGCIQPPGRRSRRRAAHRAGPWNRAQQADDCRQASPRNREHHQCAGWWSEGEGMFHRDDRLEAARVRALA